MNSKKNVVVVGAGLAALYFIHKLSPEIAVWWVKDYPSNLSNSYLAKGGIAVSEGPDVDLHIQDTLNAGAGLCNADTVKEIITAAEGIFSDLRADGVVFGFGNKLEGGHAKPRVKFISDQTGKHLVNHYASLVSQRTNMKIFEPFSLLQIDVDGLTGLKKLELVNLKNGSTCSISCSILVMATGGMSGLFKNSSNSIHAKGGGVACLLPLLPNQNLAFIQFHPTLLYQENQPAHHLITEALRGAGAIIRNKKGEDFLSKVHSKGSLAPRDVVSLGIYRELQRTNSKYVNLDISEVLNLKKDFNFLYNLFKSEGLFKQTHIPIVPGAHYQCGGIVANTNGTTQLPGCFVLGELACTGLHGANRLASNSLLELFYMGKQAAKLVNEIAFTKSKFKTYKFTYKLTPNTQDLFIVENLPQILWRDFGVIRNVNTMENAIQLLTQLEHSNQLQLNEKRLATKAIQGQLKAALAMAQDAFSRKKSQGSHIVEPS
jgi:L-aspartate oxidase